MKREPLAVIGGSVALVQAVIALTVTFGWLTLNDEELTALLGVVALAGTLAVTIFGRIQVTPVADPRNNDGDQLVPYVGGGDE